MSTTHKRAKPLPPAQRRQAIIDAIVPLLLDKGAAVSSRQMAEAAGVAEGTIFSVFPDKPAVIKAAVKSSMDPAPVCASLGKIPGSAPMATQLETAATVLLGHGERVATLVGVLRSIYTSPPRRSVGIPQFVRESNVAILAALTNLLDRHADTLRVPPQRAAVALWGLVFTNAHPMAGPDQRTTPLEIVDLLLYGIVADNGRTAI